MRVANTTIGKTFMLAKTTILIIKTQVRESA